MRLFKLPVEPQVVFDLNQKGESAAKFLEPSWQKPTKAVYRFWREHGLAAPDLPFFLQDFNEAGSTIDERLAIITARPRAAKDSFSTMTAADEDYDWTENESHGPSQGKERESRLAKFSLP